MKLGTTSTYTVFLFVGLHAIVELTAQAGLECNPVVNENDFKCSVFF